MKILQHSDSTRCRYLFPYYLRGKCREVSRASASSGGAIRNVPLQGSLGRFRTGFFAGSRAADQTSYVSSRELAQDRSPELFRHPGESALQTGTFIFYRSFHVLDIVFTLRCL